jgi:hypothetical protein
VSSPDIAVKSDTHLDKLLRDNGVQLWRIPILVVNGGVKVFRGKGQVKPDNAQMQLKAGDVVRLIVPLPKACAQALQREANDNWRDYAIVPGDTPYDARLRKFIQARTNTILLKDRQMFTLQGFVRGLASSDEITNPIRSLLIVSHASVRGSFKISLYPASAAEYVHYEDLEDAVAKKSIIVDVSLMMPRPIEDGGITHPHLWLIGCEVGGQAPYMLKFKEALGGKIEISAPKHRVIGASLVVSLASLNGEVAYMAYHFRALFPTPQKKGPAAGNKRALVDAFVGLVKSKSPGFLLENGAPVPATYWAQWIPTDLNAKPILVPTDKAREFPNMVVAPMRKLRMSAPRDFGYIKQYHYFDGPSTIELRKDTGDETSRREAVKTSLQRHPRFTAKHPFPEYVRYGYATMDEFMDGWNWQFSYDDKKKALTFDPIRDEYHVWQPITRVAKGTLVWNYYPTAPSAKKSKKPPPNILLQVTDPFFFGMY